MKARATTEAMCPGCKMKTKIKFRVPGHLETAVMRFKCSGCESELMFKTKKPQKSLGVPEGQFHAGIKILTESKLLIDMKREEAEHNAKPDEEMTDGQDAQG